MMHRILAATLCALVTFPMTAAAQDRVKLGYGRLITNDFIGDARDRWHSGSVASSRIWGRGWTGQAPAQIGNILELRLGAEIMAPDDLARPAAGDRPYAAAVSVGLHSHFMVRHTEIALGADMVITGPQTGLDTLQSEFHDLLGVAGPSAGVRRAQIKNGIHPTAVLEMGRSFAFGGAAELRPFVEARLGAESLLRVGADLAVGQIGRGELLVRDPVSGQRYRTMQLSDNGYTFVLGADIAKVNKSIFLPTPTYQLTDARKRVRAGVHWQGKKSSGFYGLTWLDKDHVGQGSGQVVGSLRLNFDF